MKLIDTHCHLQMDKYSPDRAEVIQRALEKEIGMIVVGTTLVDSVEGVKLAEQYPDQPVYAAVGVHPTDEDLENIHPAHLQALLGSKKIVAIGECGLDYFHVIDADAQNLQADIFEQHILLARQASLPLIVHCRDQAGTFEAYEDVLGLLTRHHVPDFVMHCYSGTWDLAQKFLDLGGNLSFTANITYPKNELLHEAVQKAPFDRIIVETDAPFLAPQSVRGQRNEPVYVQEVAKKIAEIRDLALAEVEQMTTANARRLFRLR